MDLKFKVHFALVLLFLAHFGESQTGVFDITKYGANSNADISEVSHAFFSHYLVHLRCVTYCTYFHLRK